mmetsp:Transcript_82372/g.176407  ORF Transcript_82372/g.176407 Transcript_82372/m.176407 type:complete len:972 (-) Transcript_82372:105-3020(-)
MKACPSMAWLPRSDRGRHQSTHSVSFRRSASSGPRPVRVLALVALLGAAVAWVLDGPDLGFSMAASNRPRAGRAGQRAMPTKLAPEELRSVPRKLTRLEEARIAHERREAEKELTRSAGIAAPLPSQALKKKAIVAAPKRPQPSTRAPRMKAEKETTRSASIAAPLPSQALKKKAIVAAPKRPQPSTRAPSMRRAPAPQPSSLSKGRAVQMGQRPGAGLTADIFGVPAGYFSKMPVWKCPGRGQGDRPFSWRHNGWTNIANVIPERLVIVGGADVGQGPPADGCERIEEGDLSAEIYAKLVGEVMANESRDVGRRGRKVVSRTVLHKGHEIKLEPKFTFRGLEEGGHPYITVVVDTEAILPKGVNFGKTPSSKVAVAALVGLKVRPVGMDDSMEICDCGEPQVLTPDKKKELMDLIKTYELKELTRSAPEGELLLCVSKNCQKEKNKRYTYVASALRPAITQKDQEKLRRVDGWENWTTLPTKALLLNPHMRKKVIDDELVEIHRNLGWRKPLIRAQYGGKKGLRFGQLSKPKLTIGKGTVLPASPSPNEVWRQLVRHGPLRWSSPQEPVRLQCMVFGSTTPAEDRSVQKACEAVRMALGGLGITVSASSGALIKADASAAAVGPMLDKHGLGGGDAVLLFGPQLLSTAATRIRERAKFECLKRGSVGVDGDTRHLASQWFDLSKKTVWSEDKVNSGAPSVKNVALALLAKLGHSPYGVDASSWLGSGAAGDVDIAVVGYDVCHLPDPHAPGQKVALAAGIRISSSEGSSSGASVLGKIESHVQRVSGETVPLENLKRLIPPEFAKGRVVIVHRDGEFPNIERAAWEEYQRELDGTGTAFVLIEIVKWAGGKARLYKDGTKTGNAPEGSVVFLSDNEVLLVSSDPFQGTANPLNLRLKALLGSRAHELVDDAWLRSVFELSFLHHGSLFRAPRLPVTTHMSDRLAYLVAEGGSKWDDELEKNSAGTQQFWL